MFFDFDPSPVLTAFGLTALPDWVFAQAATPPEQILETITIKGSPASQASRTLGGVVDQRE